MRTRQNNSQINGLPEQATLRMRLRHSWGSELSVSSTTLTKWFAFHPSPGEISKGTLTPSNDGRMRLRQPWLKKVSKKIRPLGKPASA